MQYREYGDGNPGVILLLHGGGLSWWSCREAAKRLSQRHHVILPILDGHAGSDRPFTSIEDNAEEIIAYIDAHHGGRVLMIGGLSLGAQILTEILARRSDICRCAVAESALLLPMPVTRAMIGPALAMSYGLIKKPWFARLQFASLRLKPALYEEYYADSCAITRENMTAFLQANAAYALPDAIRKTTARVLILAGSREAGKMRRSARLLHEALPSSTLCIRQGLYHGEYSISHAAAYADHVLSFLHADAQ